jgi:hypothetical protein
MRLNFTEYSFGQIMAQFRARFDASAVYKEWTNSSKFKMLSEMLAAVTEMIMYYIERRAEETYAKTAKLDSSAILISQGLGYVVKRAIPAQAEIIVSVKGAVPDWVQPGMSLVFNRNLLKLSAGGSKMVLMKSFIYELTDKDLANPTALNIMFDSASMVGSDKGFEPIKVAFGEFAEQRFSGIPIKHQKYKINDTDFSNWFGSEDYGEGLDAYCQVWISNDGKNWNSTNWGGNVRKFKVNRTFKIGDPSENNCVIETDMDKLPVIKFGDKRTWGTGAEEIAETQGVSNRTQFVHVRYLKTNGEAGNGLEIGDKISKTGPVLINDSEMPSLEVSFSIARPSYGGADIEDRKEILGNAPREFSTFDRLVTKTDYKSWLLGLTSPFKVRHAVVWGESDELDGLNESGSKNILSAKNFANGLVYSIAGNVYDGDSIKLNFAGKGNNPLTLWTDESDAYYDSALGGCQYFQMNENPLDYISATEDDRSIIDLNWRMENKCLLSCFEHRPISPIIHYFEAVGTVTLQPMADIQAVKTDALLALHEALEKKGFCQRIDKSEVEEIILAQQGVQAVSLRFTPMHDTNSKTFNMETGILALNSLNNFLDANPVYNGASKSTIIREIYDIVARWFMGNRIYDKTEALRYAADHDFPALWMSNVQRKDGPDWKGGSASNINERHYWTEIAGQIRDREWFVDPKRLYAVLKEVHGGIQRYLTNSLLDYQGNISNFTMPSEMAAVCFNRPFAYDSALVPADFSLQWKYSY